MIRGFFFDLDGTLVDTHVANYEAYKKALSDFGIQITFAEFKKTIGQQAKHFLPRLAPQLDPSDYEQLSTQKAEYYKEALVLSKANVELIKFLGLVAKDHHTVLVTSARPESAAVVLTRHKLTDYFDHVITNADVNKSKPAPDCYQMALAKTGLDPNEVIVFEDSDTGIASAEAAGIKAIVQIKNFSL